MATAPLSSSTLIKSNIRCPHSHSPSSFLPLNTFSKFKNHIRIPLLLRSLKPLRTASAIAVRAEFEASIFSTDIGGPTQTDIGPDFDDLEGKEGPECPPGLRQYETMAILRPNVSEDERLAFIQRYEQLLVDGGAMYVEVLNKGVRPLAYTVKKKNKAGETIIYLDSIQILFTYFTKPELIPIIGETLQRDDDVIRSSSFKIRK